MNGYNTTDYIGALGEYYLINCISNVSNILESHISNNPLIHSDTYSNTIIYSSNEIQFSNINNSFNTKIDNNGILRVYYNYNISAPTIPTQWLGVENSLSYFYGQDSSNQLQFTQMYSNISNVSNILESHISNNPLIHSKPLATAVKSDLHSGAGLSADLESWSTNDSGSESPL